LLARQQPDLEKELRNKRILLDNMRKQETERLGEFLANTPLLWRKQVLSRINAAIFGESANEIEILKHAQQVLASRAKGCDPLS
jgi:hypothetical protein